MANPYDEEVRAGAEARINGHDDLSGSRGGGIRREASAWWGLCWSPGRPYFRVGAPCSEKWVLVSRPCPTVTLDGMICEDFTVMATLFAPPAGVLKPVGAMAVTTVLPGVDRALNSARPVFVPALIVTCDGGRADAPVRIRQRHGRRARRGIGFPAPSSMGFPFGIDLEEGADRLNLNRGAIAVEPLGGHRQLRGDSGVGIESDTHSVRSG